MATKVLEVAEVVVAVVVVAEVVVAVVVVVVEAGGDHRQARSWTGGGGVTGLHILGG